MKVFKNYFKIISKHMIAIVSYMVIFFVIIMGFAKSNDNNGDYSSIKVDVYVDNQSQDLLAKGLEDYLKKNFNFVDLNKEYLDDELFYGYVSSLITIPKDFETSNKVIYKTAPASTYGMLPKQAINNYISKYKSYVDSGFSKENAINAVDEDLSKKAQVSIERKNNEGVSNNSEYYFNFINYVLMAQIILVVSTVMIVYNKETMANRNKVSPLSAASQNFQLILGHIVSGLVFWLIYMMFFAVMWPDSRSLASTRLMMLNSFIFTITVVTLSMFLSKLIKKESALSAIMNVVALGSSFLCGAFVPQELLSDTTIKMSKVLPSYYYITNNNMIVKNPTLETMAPYAFVMIGYSLLFIVLTIVLEKRKRD